jgi:hypothetical protein
MSLTLRSEEIRDQIFYKLLRQMVVNKVMPRKYPGLCCFSGIMGGLGRRGTRKVASKFPGMLQNLEHHLCVRGGSPDGLFFCGSSPCYADVALFDCIDATCGLACIDEKSVLSGCPKLAVFLEKMRTLPSLQAYLAQRPKNMDALFAEKYIRGEL